MSGVSAGHEARGGHKSRVEERGTGRQGLAVCEWARVQSPVTLREGKMGADHVGPLAPRESPGESEDSEEGGGKNWVGLVGPL